MAALLSSQTVDVGTGAPNATIAQQFQNAFFRNGFAYLVSLPPSGLVTRFGSSGLIQEFNGAPSTGSGGNTTAATGGHYALVESNLTGAVVSGGVQVAQVLAPMYAYYGSIGPTTAGYPLNDTQTCPPQPGGGTCQYQNFSLKYILFTNSVGNFNGTNFAIRDPFYTKWNAVGGLNGVGPPADIERNITGQNKVAATVQIYAGGAIYSVTSGSLSGSVFAVAAPVYALYAANGADAGFLGLPTSDDFPLAGGGRRQSFQGGNIDYTSAPGVTPAPVVELPVASVSILPSFTTVYPMKQGDTLALQASAFAANGAGLTGRLVSWVTSNSSVVSISSAPGSAAAVATAVGQGTALVSAISEGVASPRLTIDVTSNCCQIGDGASAVAQQAMQAAVTRDQLAIQLPAKAAAQRVGAGYQQTLSSTATPPVSYLVSKADSSPSAWIVTGDNLARYLALGGAAGPLGYATSDGVGAGHQLFAGGALASSPARLVTGAILAKWSALGFETGVAGLPTADASAAVSQAGNKAQQQTFAKATIYAETTGPTAGQAQAVTGLILARYLALGGPGSAFGLPVDDAFGAGGRTRQDFEGGYIDFGPGDAVATEHGAQRSPSVSATPASVVAGSRLHLAVAGFDDGATLRVSVSGQPDFVVTAPNGSYTWDTYVPLGAASRSVAIHAVDMANAGASADGSYTVKALSSSSLQLAKARGDGQSGALGALLAQALQVKLQDAGGNGVSGVPVAFAASSGGRIVSASAVTDAAGQAQAVVRLPAVAGLALFTATASGQVATFSATAAAMSLANYPAFLQSDAPYGVSVLGAGPASIAQKGSLLTAAAGIVRYYVNHGDLAGPAADPGSLNTYLQGLCLTAADGSHLCDGFLNNPASSEQVVNLWRIAGWVGGKLDVSIETPDPAAARDLVSQGSPVLLALAMTANGAPAGGHYVVATGVAADGGLLIRDPSPDFAQTNLGAYLGGFQAGGVNWQGALSGAIRLLPRAPSGTGFLAAFLSQPAGLMQQLSFDIASAAGSCGQSADFGDEAGPPASGSGPLVSRFRYCEGSQPIYQLSLAGPQPYRAALLDLAPGGGRIDLSGAGAAVAYQASRGPAGLALAPQTVVITAGGVVNGATFTSSPGLAPGGVMAIFGAGLAGAAGGASVQIGGEAAPILSQTPFQVNVQVPADLDAGSYTVDLRSPYGAAQQPIQMQANAPAIFLLASATAASPAYGAVVNQDGSINAPTSPGQRGQTLVIYCTGLGAVDGGSPASAVSPVSVVLSNMSLTPVFAGATPGLIGLYQVNLPVPETAPPGIDLPLALRQSGGDSNTVFVAIQ